MKSNRLELNIEKLEILLGGNYDHLGSLLLALNEVTPLPPPRTRSIIWVCFWTLLFWWRQISAVARSAFFQLRQIAHLQPYSERKSLLTLIHTLIMGIEDYYNALSMGLSLKVEWRLQLVQNGLVLAFYSHNSVSQAMLPIEYGSCGPVTTGNWRMEMCGLRHYWICHLIFWEQNSVAS